MGFHKAGGFLSGIEQDKRMPLVGLAFQQQARRDITECATFHGQFVFLLSTPVPQVSPIAYFLLTPDPCKCQKILFFRNCP